jgi:hypothetical protein
LRAHEFLGLISLCLAIVENLLIKNHSLASRGLS